MFCRRHYIILVLKSTSRFYLHAKSTLAVVHDMFRHQHLSYYSQSLFQLKVIVANVKLCRASPGAVATQNACHVGA